jgi:hypothetical protein
MSLQTPRGFDGTSHMVKACGLYTNEAMMENIKLYYRLGYSKTHKADENGLRRVYMAKPLTRAFE